MASLDHLQIHSDEHLLIVRNHLQIHSDDYVLSVRNGEMNGKIVHLTQVYYSQEVTEGR